MTGPMSAEQARTMMDTKATNYGIGRSTVIAGKGDEWHAAVDGAVLGPFATEQEAVQAAETHWMTAPLTTAQLRGEADPMLEQIEHWFMYHSPTPGQVEAMRDLRNAAKLFARIVVTLCPPSADRSVAIRHIREAVMTANASIVLGGK